jgi:TolB-like protein/class 3 adenylate cyclase
LGVATARQVPGVSRTAGAPRRSGASKIVASGISALAILERKLAAILAADVAGYSRLMELDEAGTFERLKARRAELIEPAIAAHRGSIFKLMGDGLLAEFASVVDAVECAVDIQRGMAERNANLPEDHRIDVRIGVNLGEVIIEGTDRHGEGVNIAARLQQLADPGGVCISGKVANEVEKKLAFGFEPMGEQRVKNISEPIPVYRVKLDGVRVPAKRKPPRSAPAGWARPVIATMVLLAGLVAAGWYGLARSPSHLVGTHVPSIAVLPFDDMSPDKSLGYLGDGVSDDIITMLSRFPDLSVIARNSSFVYKGKPVDIRQIGRDLNIDYALEGSVRKEADQIRITAQLIDTATGQHVWAERYDKAGKDPLALQDEVTAKIVGAMTGENGQVKQGQYRAAWGRDAADLGEYDYYLRGHDILMNARSKEENDRAGRIWEEGLAKYPDSNLLKVKLGVYHFISGFSFWSDDIPAEYRKAGVIVREVLARENLSPQVKRYAHWLFALVLASERDFDRALSEAETAISLAPYDASLIGYISPVPIMSGAPAKALDWIEFAANHDPNAAKDISYKRGWALRLLGKPEDSLAAFKQADMSGDAPLNIAIDLVRLGRIDEAKAQVTLMLKKNNPKFTQAIWREGYFYSDPSIVEAEVADLAKAGLPEK